MKTLCSVTVVKKVNAFENCSGRGNAPRRLEMQNQFNGTCKYNFMNFQQKHENKDRDFYRKIGFGYSPC